ncbi:MAG: HEAT repeat domain-containing protein [Anaerolineae bacterium]|nr:HEAT repeat domain-containing protein [Anaerolineae bacterium]
MITTDSNVTALIIALRTEDRRAHTLVVDDLVRIGAPAVEPLISVLDDPNPNVRSGAARALGKIGDTRALGSLIFRLRYDSDVEVRKSAVWALHMGGGRAVGPLIEALRDPDEWVRFGAVIVLAKIGDPAIDPLINALRDNLPLVRANAAETLGRIADYRAAEALGNALHDPDDNVWQQAAVSLGRMRDARAVKPLIRMVQSPASVLRTKAIKALGQIRDVRAVDPLIDVVYNEQDRWMRLFAIEALGHIGDLRTIEVLVDSAYDDSRDVRTKAIVTLGEIESALATDALYSVFEDMEVDVEDQQTALFELGKRGDPRAVGGLIDLLQYDPKVDNRIYAALVLGDIGGSEAVDSLIDTLCDDVPDVADHALKSLVKLGRTATEPLLQSLRESTDAERRMWVIRALGDIGSAQAVAALLEVALNEAETWWVREEARTILNRLGHNPQQPD